jgi:hypothetical protein
MKNLKGLILERIKIILIIIFIFTAGFVTSQIFYTPMPVKYELQKGITSVVLGNIEEEPKLPAKQEEISVKDINGYIDKIAQLEDELSLKSMELESLHRDENSKKKSEDLIESSSNKYASMTIEQAEAILPKPYSDMVASTGGMMIELLQKHLIDEFDYNWAPNMEQKFTDFIYMHPLSSGIELQSITCKTSTCELIIIELEGFTWDRISHDMSKQDWYSFYVGATQRTVDSKKYIYEMLSIK